MINVKNSQWANVIIFLIPELTFVISLFFLMKNYNYAFIYFIGYFINYLFNHILKGWFQERRADDESKLLKIEKIFRKNISFETYAMPSTAMQSMFYSLVYTYNVLKNINMLIFNTFLCFIIMFERVYNKHHTFKQVVAGAIIGSFVGYGGYIIGKKVNRGQQKEKEDDNFGLNKEH